MSWRHFGEYQYQNEVSNDCETAAVVIASLHYNFMSETRCRIHPDYDGQQRPAVQCSGCSVMYMSTQSERYLHLEWSSLEEVKAPLIVRAAPTRRNGSQS